MKELQEEFLNLRTKLATAEQSRVSGEQTFSIEESRRRLEGIYSETGNLELGALETKYLLSIPGMKEKLTEGKNFPLFDCVPESKVDW